MLFYGSMESAVLSPESLAPWMGATAAYAIEPAERVREWWERADRVYPENTKKAWRSDWAVFMAHCEPTQKSVAAGHSTQKRLRRLWMRAG